MKLLFLLLNVCVCVVVGSNFMDPHLEEKVEESFSEREVGCKDSNSKCEGWAKKTVTIYDGANAKSVSGCEGSDSKWMADNCKLSCGKCGNTGNTGNTVDVVDVEWTSWSAWPPCTEKCGGGTQMKTRTQANGITETKSRSCNSQLCPTDSGTTNSGPPKPKPGNAGNGCGIQGNSRSNSYIRGGTDADEGEWPWQVLVDDGKGGTCGGTIISPHCVITAAHCVVGEQYLTLWAGVHSRWTKEMDSNVQRRFVGNSFAVHPDYSGIKNDVAVIKLEQPFDFNRYVNAACLPKPGNSYAGINGTGTGFGRISSENEQTADILQELSYPINANNVEACKACSTSFCWFPEPNTICAAATSEYGMCMGDSGGPLVVKGADKRWSVVGIASYVLTDDCNSANYFMRVTSYLDFIEEHCQ